MYGLSPIRFNSVSMVTATMGVNDGQVGDVVQSGDEKYILVYNDGTSQISVGHAATVSGVTGYSVTVSTTTMIDHVVGVCKHATLTTATYGYLLVRGFSPVAAPANSGIAAGQLLTVGGDGKLTVKSISTDAPGATIGKCVVATASAGVGHAFINLY